MTIASEHILANNVTPTTPASGKNGLFFGSSVYPKTIDSSAVVRLLGGSIQTVQAYSDKTGTANTTGVMLGTLASFTPASTGHMIFIANGNLTNSTATAGNGCKAGIRYDTVASQPANGDALTGNVVSNIITSVLERNTSDLQGFCCVGGVSLTVGVTYWLDLTQAAIVGGTGQIKTLTLTFLEVY